MTVVHDGHPAFAPDCLICDLTKALHEAYKEASWARKSLDSLAKQHPTLDVRGSDYAKMVEARSRKVARDLFSVSKHGHNGLTA